MVLLPLSPDELLSTTRSVRKRLDLTRLVEREVIVECLRLAQQAPTSSNSQGWHFIVVTDPVKRKALADLYVKAGYHVPDELPGFESYLSTKYPDLSEEARATLARHFEELIADNGLTSALLNHTEEMADDTAGGITP